jgi:nicotinamidase-related amidase
MDLHTKPHFATSALITIDVQRDVLDGQPLEIAGTSAVLPTIEKLAHAFRAHQRPIVHIVRIYLQDGSNADRCRRDALEKGAQMLNPGTNGVELAEAILPAGSIRLDTPRLLSGGIQAIGNREVIIFKSRWGAFYKTPLEDHLRAEGVDTLVFAGANFPNCPRTSMYEASERDFRVVAVDDAISGLYERGRSELDKIGVVRLAALGVVDQLSSRAV